MLVLESMYGLGGSESESDGGSDGGSEEAGEDGDGGERVITRVSETVTRIRLPSLKRFPHRIYLVVIIPEVRLCFLRLFLMCCPGDLPPFLPCRPLSSRITGG